MEDLAIADQAVDMGFGEEIRGRGDQQYVGALFIQRVAHSDAGVLLDIFLDAFQGILQRGLGQSEIVADLEDLADDLVAVFLPDADAVHDLAGGHGDLRGIDAVGAEHRAAAALRALVEIAVPVVQHFFGEVDRADELREIFAGKSEITAVDLAQQVLAGNRHVFRVAGAEVVMTLVRAGAAFDAGVQEDLERAVLAGQFLHLVERDLFPVLDQFTGKSQLLLEFRLGHEGFTVRHRPFMKERDDGIFLQFRCFEVSHG